MSRRERPDQRDGLESKVTDAEVTLDPLSAPVE